MHARYRDRAEFLTVYVSEAHPDDEWQMDSNRKDKIVIKQPRAFTERREAAKILVERLHYDIPLAIDGMENRAEAAYAAWPERLYIVEKGGGSSTAGDWGPSGSTRRRWSARFRRSSACRSQHLHRLHRHRPSPPSRGQTEGPPVGR